MPDRRQGDRRDSSGFENKKITISLPVFILSFTICLVILISVIVCTFCIKKSYTEGYMDCYQSIYDYDDDYYEDEDYYETEEDDEDLTDLSENN